MKTTFRIGDRSCEPLQTAKNVIYISMASFFYFLSTELRLLSVAIRQAYSSFSAYKSSSTSNSETNQVIVKFTAVYFITTEGLKVWLYDRPDISVNVYFLKKIQRGVLKVWFYNRPGISIKWYFL